MLRNHRALLLYCLLAAAIGAALGVAWYLVTGRSDMPIPVVGVLAVASALISQAVEQVVSVVRSQRRRTALPARHRKAGA